MNRRSFLGSILAAGLAPAIVKAGILMPVRSLALPRPICIFMDDLEDQFAGESFDLLRNVDLSEQALEDALIDMGRFGSERFQLFAPRALLATATYAKQHEANLYRLKIDHETLQAKLREMPSGEKLYPGRSFKVFSPTEIEEDL